MSHEVELLNVPFMVIFPPQNLGAAVKPDTEPHEEHLRVSVWLKYKSSGNSMKKNWNWVPLQQWIQRLNGEKFASHGTLEKLRDLITRRALLEPFEMGLSVDQITVEIRRQISEMPALNRDKKTSGNNGFNNDGLEEVAIIRHTVSNPSRKRWGFSEDPDRPRGILNPQPFIDPVTVR